MALKMKNSKGRVDSACFFSFIGVVLVVGSLTASFVLLSHHKMKQEYDILFKKMVIANKKMTYHNLQRAKREIFGQSSEHNIVKRNAAGSSFVETEPSLSYGAAYVRWGRQDCPGDAELVYSGIAAGAHYTHTGGGSNYLCIYDNITYPIGTYHASGNQFSSYIYGLEWRQGNTYNMFDFSDVNGATIDQKTPSCAICLAKPRSTHVMIPGRHTCPAGWHFEYNGFIMGTHHGHKQSGEYICIDKRPQAIHGTEGVQDGALLYLVETQCGSLPCGPIVGGYELQCVVCTI